MVQPGDRVVFQQRTVWRPVPGLEHAAAQTLRLVVAYEDDHMAVVVKPQGMPTQVTLVCQPVDTSCGYFVRN